MQTPEIISRADAKARGFKHYFTGKPCPKGHVTTRHVSGGSCVGCKQDWSSANPGYAKERYWEDPDASKQKSKDYRQRTGYDAKRYQELRDSERARNKDYVEKNRTTLMAKVRQRRAANLDEHRSREKARRERKPEVHLANNLRRRASRYSATPSWYGEFDRLIDLEAADLCRRRECATGVKWHIDHMIPLQAIEACGLHIGVNIQVIPALINIRKRNTMNLTQPGEWLKKL